LSLAASSSRPLDGAVMIGHHPAYDSNRTIPYLRRFESLERQQGNVIFLLPFFSGKPL
jgi:hypothetical protein